jgi:hypothetical protein
MRRIDKCLNCGDEREIVANRICAKCYMARRREAEKRDEPSWASPDRSQRRYIAERNKMLVNLTKIAKIVDETPCLSPEDAVAIKTVIRPYLLERAESLAPKLQVNTLTQNSEFNFVAYRQKRCDNCSRTGAKNEMEMFAERLFYQSLYLRKNSEGIKTFRTSSVE